MPQKRRKGACNMTEKHSEQVVYTQMKTRGKGDLRDSTEYKSVFDLHKKRRLRNMVLSSAAVFCLTIGSIALIANTDKAEMVLNHVTTDFEYDETLGRLQFVSSVLPESAMVFLESSDTDTAIEVFSPVSGNLTHVWSQSEPWFEYTSSNEIRACRDGEIMAVVKNHDDEYTVRMLHDDGYESLYSGLSEVYVNHLDSVQSGKPIGISSGEASFEMRKDGLSIKPQFAAED